MKRVVLFGIMLMLFCSGCSAKEEPKQEKEQQEQIQTQSTENTEIEDREDVKTDTETEETDEAGDIQKELAKIEEQSIGYENADWSSMGPVSYTHLFHRDGQCDLLPCTPVCFMQFMLLIQRIQ